MSKLSPSVQLIKIGEGKLSPTISLESKQGYINVIEDEMMDPKIYSGDLGDADTWDDLQVS